MKEPITLWLVAIRGPFEAKATPFVAYADESDAIFFADQQFGDSTGASLIKGTFTPDEDAAQYEQPAGEASKAHQGDLDLYHVRAWAEKHNIRGDYESVTAAFFDARNR